MAFLFSWLKSKPIPPARVTTDTVIPLHSLDDTNVNRSVALDLSLNYEDVLDVGKLAGALERLLERPGWRKLGARLRMNSDGKLEYHIPAEYTKERPAINLSHVSHDMPISEHPQGCKLPRSTGSIQVTSDVSPYRSLLVSNGSPTKLDDWLYTDRAQVSLHVVSFTDATLVTLTWLHTLLDIMGKKTLLRAWTAMLEGREDDVPEFYGYDFDPLATLGAPIDETQSKGTPEEEEYVYKHKALSGWRMFRWVLGYMWELLVYRQEEMRTVILPDAYLKKLRSGALNDLSAIHPATIVMDTSNPTHPKPFLTDGDILCAWWTRLVISSQPWLSSASPNKAIQIMNVLGMRPLLTETSSKLLPKGIAYIGNCTTHILSFFTLQEFLSLPLGLVAARIRSDLVTQSARAQVEANMRLAKAAMAKTGHPPLYGEADMMFSVFTNWTKSDMFDTDFKGAVAREGKGEHVVGKPTGVFGDATTKGFSVRNSGSCVGMDGNGNWWLAARLRVETWRNVERALEEMR